MVDCLSSFLILFTSYLDFVLGNSYLHVFDLNRFRIVNSFHVSEQMFLGGKGSNGLLKIKRSHVHCVGTLQRDFAFQSIWHLPWIAFKA